MTRIPERTKLLVWLTAGILVALFVVPRVAGAYAAHGAYVKGSGPLLSLFYLPALLLATTLLPLLVSRYRLWHILFRAALVVWGLSVAFVFKLFITFDAQPHLASLQDYVGWFPVPCDIALVSLYLVYLKRR